jgi:hypothetical protein
MMNRHRFHIMPSKYEGFGHYIHEAIGCGGIVLTTDARPMNEFRGITRQALIEPGSQAQHARLLMAFSVSPLRHRDNGARDGGIAANAGSSRYRTNARRSFLADREDFRKAFGALAVIFDCFPFFNELDVLEVRLHELAAEWSTRTIIVESQETYGGDARELLLFWPHRLNFGVYARVCRHDLVY